MAGNAQNRYLGQGDPSSRNYDQGNSWGDNGGYPVQVYPDVQERERQHSAFYSSSAAHPYGRQPAAAPLETSYGSQEYPASRRPRNHPNFERGFIGQESSVSWQQYQQGPASSSDAEFLTSIGSGTYSRLHEGFQMRYDDLEFFVKGRVFSCLWSESVGETPSVDQRVGPRFSPVCFGGTAYTNIQRFVVIFPRHEQRFSFCCPIKTYGGRGTAKNPLSHHQHSIIYSQGKEPFKHKNEPEFEKKAICMVPTDPSQQLDPMSRLNFGKPTPVEHNLKVHHIGNIHKDHLHRLMRYYFEENNENRISSLSEDPRALTPRISTNPNRSTSLPQSIPDGYRAPYEPERTLRQPTKRSGRV